MLAIVRCWRPPALAAAPHASPAASCVATWSLAAARLCASARGSFGAGAARWPAPHPARSSALQTESQTAGQRVRQTCIEDLLLRPLHRVGNAVERGAVPVEVEDDVGGAGVAVARLSHRAGIEQPAARREVDLRLRGSERVAERAPLRR